MKKYWEKFAGFIMGLWDILLLVFWLIPATVQFIYALAKQESKKKAKIAWDSFYKWAWDQDKKLTPEEKQRLWDTAFVDGAEDLREEKKLRKKAKKEGWTLGVLTKEWYSDDPEFDGYREYDRQNPNRFDVRYDENLNRI